MWLFFIDKSTETSVKNMVIKPTSQAYRNFVFFCCRPFKVVPSKTYTFTITQLSQGFCVNMIAYKHFRKSSIKTMLCLFKKRMYGQFLHGLIFAQSNIKLKVHRILRLDGGQVDVSLCLTCTWMLPTVYPRQIKIKSFIKKRLMSYLLNKFITTFLSNM